MTIARNRRGFTLIELLLVISIIGLIATVFLLGQHDTSAKRRDVKRYADAKQLQDALALYIGKMQTYPVYSGCLDGNDPVNVGLKAQSIITPDAKLVDPLTTTDITKCYYYIGTATNYSFKYTIEQDNSASKAGTYTITP